MLAAQQGRTNVIRRLLREGANIDHQNEVFKTHFDDRLRFRNRGGLQR